MSRNVYWINGPWQGKLALIARPRGGDWLVDDVEQWRRTGLDLIVSLLTRSERSELDLEREQEIVENSGLDYLSSPIPDRGVPSSFWEVRTFVENVTARLSEGQNVGIHCRQGVGRSALVIASVLAYAGVAPDAAFKQIGAVRGCTVPETPEQRQWVERFAVLEPLYA